MRTFLNIKGKQSTRVLLLTISLVFVLGLSHWFFIYNDLYHQRFRLRFLPIWYSLSFGPLLYFYVKSKLYSSFYFQKKDYKHFILATIQIVVYLMAFIQDIEAKERLWYNFYMPYFGPFEKLAYAISVPFYLYFAYRFIKFELRKAQWHKIGWKIDRSIRLKRLIKTFIVLFGIHLIYMTIDVLGYMFLGISLSSSRGFEWMYVFSFSAITGYWLYCAVAPFPSYSLMGEKNVILKKIKDNLEKDKIYLNPDLTSKNWAYLLKINDQQLKKLLKEAYHKTFALLILHYRIEAAKELLHNHKTCPGLTAGFASEKIFNKLFKKEMGVLPEEYMKNDV